MKTCRRRAEKLQPKKRKCGETHVHTTHRSFNHTRHIYLRANSDIDV